MADNAEKLQQELKRIGYNLGTSGKNKDGVDGKWGKQSQAALDQAFKEGYVFQNGKLINPSMKVAQPYDNNWWNSLKNQMSNNTYDNMYPYNYGDVKK